MNNFRLTTYLTSNADLDSEMISQLVSNCSLRHFKKGEFLLREGERCKHSFFVEKGLLRQFTIDNKGKEHIIQFAPENWFAVDRESAFFDNPSIYFIQAIEDCDVFLIDEDFLLNLAENNSSFLHFNNRLLHNHIRHLQRRITQLLSAEAQERYLEFIKIYPDVLLRVPQTMVASYLGITPESLSRIRKAMAESHRKSS